MSILEERLRELVADIRAGATADIDANREISGVERPWLIGKLEALLTMGSHPHWPFCPDHLEVQHRDGKPPWCETCGWNRGRPATPPTRISDVQTLEAQLDAVPATTPRTWPEDSWPTAEQLLDWLLTATRPEQLETTARAIENGQRASTCLMFHDQEHRGQPTIEDTTATEG